MSHLPSSLTRMKQKLLSLFSAGFPLNAGHDVNGREVCFWQSLLKSAVKLTERQQIKRRVAMMQFSLKNPLHLLVDFHEQ